MGSEVRGSLVHNPNIVNKLLLNKLSLLPGKNDKAKEKSSFGFISSFHKSKFRIDKFDKFRIDTVIGQHTEIIGDIPFNGNLYVKGIVNGNIMTSEDFGSLLILNEQGSIKGEVRVPNIFLNGTVIGNVLCRRAYRISCK